VVDAVAPAVLCITAALVCTSDMHIVDRQIPYHHLYAPYRPGAGLPDSGLGVRWGYADSSFVGMLSAASYRQA